jgi:two-component system, NarL family, sensor kinase
MRFFKPLSPACILLILVTCSKPALSQNGKLDSLYSLLALSKDVKSKINLTNNIAFEIRSINADSSLSIAENALKMSMQENYSFGMATSYLCKAFAYIVKGRYELSYDNGQKAADIANTINNDSVKAFSLIVYASYNSNKGNYDIAIANALDAVKLFEKTKNLSGVLRTKNLMCQIYQLKNDLEKAENILKETLSLFPKINEPKIKMSALHTLANVYGMEGKYKEALALDSQGIKLCEAEKNEFLKSTFYDNMANCYMYSNRFTEAKKYFELCIKIDSSFDNKKQMSDTYLNIGNLMMMQNKFSESESYLARAVLLADSSGYKLGKYEALLLLSKLYRENKQNDKAFSALKQAYNTKDSMINEKTESKIVELETVYQTEKKEQQLKLQNAEITKKTYLLWGLAGAIALLAFSGIMFYRKKQLQNKIAFKDEVIKQQDIATKAVIAAEENERKRIAADLHDGVGQMMSAAKMNLSAIENDFTFSGNEQKNSFEKIIDMVDECCKEIRSVSHQMMPNALLKSGLASAVREFIDKIDARVLKINLHTEGLNERLDGNVETVLYRVIQECVNNVIKHAGANTLDISLIRDTDGIAATIEDNGKGFEITGLKKKEGLGLKNIKSRINFLKGTVEVDSSPGNGTLIAIHVPLV